MQQQLYNCLIGGAVGDALGLPYEGLSARRGKKLFKDKKAFNFIPFIHLGMVSDDTEHAVMTVQAWIASRHTDADTAHRHFRTRLRHHLRWWLLGLPAGIGMATGKSLFKLWAFLPNSGVFSAGNGPAMRASVLGVMIDEVDELKCYIRTSTQITHTDPKAEQGALTIALCAHYFAHHKEITPDNLLRFVSKHLDDAELLGYLHSVTEAVKTSQHLRDWIKNTFQKETVSGYMYHTVPAVFFVVSQHPDDPMRGLQTLIAAGGDVDTTCAIAGGIWGVKYGEELLQSCKGRLAEPKLTPAFMQALSEQAEIATQSQQAQAPKRFGGVITLIRNLIFLLIVLVHGVRRLLPPY